MSAFRRFFTGITDTGEDARDERLRTRYYRADQKKVCREIVAFANKEKALHLVHVNDKHGEITMEYQDPLGMKRDVVATVFAVTPVQSAVDLHVALRSRFVDIGFNVKLVARLYGHLDRQLTPLDRR